MSPRFRLVPVDEGFFELFSAAASNARDAAVRLRDLLQDPVNLKAMHREVVDFERRGDDLTRQLLHRLSTSFVTPFDREDIHALAEELDDVVDDILSVAALFELVGVDDVLPEVKEQADVLVRMGEQNVELISRLQRMKGVDPFLDAIDRLESEGDAINRRALARLFGGEFEAIEVLKWKDIIEAMEAALNTVEDISDIVESIVLKHA
jgi:predicted phosphate transport protein (TIGR00153 family)